MLTKLTAKNYRSFEHLDLDLAPMTVFVAPNAGGKSNILFALATLVRVLKGRLLSTDKQDPRPRFGRLVYSQIVFRNDIKRDISFGVELRSTDSSQVHYEIQIGQRTTGLEVIREKLLLRPPEDQPAFSYDSTDGDFVLENPPIRILAQGRVHSLPFLIRQQFDPNQQAAGHPIFKAIATLERHLSYSWYRLQGTQVGLEPPLGPSARRKSASFAEPLRERKTRVLDSGRGVVAELAALALTEPARFSAIVRSLSRQFPFIEGVHFEMMPNGRLSLRVKEAGIPEALWPEQVSEGVKLFLAILWVAHRDASPIIILEEPTAGIHPYLASEVSGVLRDITDGKIRQEPRQILVESHSRDLLNACDPTEIRIVERDPGGISTVKKLPVTDEAFQDLLEAYDRAMGELWYSGAAGGVPKDKAQDNARTADAQ